jgi:hypothetical protein
VTFSSTRRRALPFHHCRRPDIFGIFACLDRDALLFAIRIIIGSPTGVPNMSWVCMIKIIWLQLYAIVTLDVAT